MQSQNFNLKNLPKDQRPREKLFYQGAKQLSNTELLTILIGSGTQKESAMILASRVLSMQKSFALLSSCSPQDFMKISGIGEAKACILASAIELGRRIASAPSEEKPLLDNPKTVVRLYMEEMRRLPKEIFRVLMLNVKSELIMKDDISIGSINASMSHPREVFASAIRSNAYALILMHNHPSGDPTPSEADIKTTHILCDAGKVLGIQVVDHIVIGDGRYLSFREEKMLN